MAKDLKNNIYYKLIGQGPALVFIHGLLGFWRNFYSFSQALKRDYKILLYDQRGHGRSFHQEPYTVAKLAQDLKNLLDSLNCRPAILAGHSLGAYVSCFMAYHYPEYVKKLIVIDASPWPQSKREIEDILNFLPSSFLSREEARSFFKQAVKDKKFSQATADLLMANLEKKLKGPIHFLFDTKGLIKLLSEVRKQDYPLFIKNFKCPALILRGERSSHFLRSDFKKALKLNPLVRGKEIKNAGHWLHSEQPQIFIKTLQEFLSQTP